MVVLEATLTTLSYTPDMSQISSYFVNKTLRYFVFLKQSNKLYGHIHCQLMFWIYVFGLP